MIDPKQDILEKALVRNCMIEIFRANGYGNISAVTQRDYEHVSQEIEKKTSILISTSTLKRLLNSGFSRIPQTATLNAIATYLGYENWQAYKTSSNPITPTDATAKYQAQLSNTVANKITLPLTKQAKIITAAILGMVCVAIGILFIRVAPARTIEHADKATFSAEKTTNNEIPNTVVFHYNIDKVVADSFFIQQSWDENRRVRISKNNYTLTDIYYEPGYHIAKLIANNEVIKTVEVSIPTDRWFLLAKDLMPGSIPQYIKPATSIVKDGCLGLDKSSLAMNQIDATVEKNYVYAFFPSKFDVNSDNYIVKTRVKVNEVRNNLCQNLMVEIFSQRQFTYFKSSSKGCASESIVQFGETLVDGKKSDLSSLGFDVTNWADIEIKVVNRQATISLNGEIVFNTTYQSRLGFITGIAFISNGLPMVDYIALKGLDGKVVYENDFSVMP